MPVVVQLLLLQQEIETNFVFQLPFNIEVGAGHGHGDAIAMYLHRRAGRLPKAP